MNLSCTLAQSQKGEQYKTSKRNESYQSASFTISDLLSIRQDRIFIVSGGLGAARQAEQRCTKFHGSTLPQHWAGEEMRIWTKNESTSPIVGKPSLQD